MKGSKKPLAAMLDTSVMCRPDNLMMMVMESRADYLVKENLNAAKFAMFLEKENPCSLFHFSFRATFLFPL